MTAAMAPPHTLEPYPFPPTRLAGREIEAARSLRLAAISETSQDIVLHTREGDTVSLSMDSETVAVYGRDARLAISQRYRANDEGGHSAEERLAFERQEWFGLQTTRTISLSTEGDLSEDEMRDIRKALHRIDGLIGRSFGIGQQGGDARRAGLAGLDTLSGIEVDIQDARTILAARSTNIAATTYNADGRTLAVPDQPTESPAPLWQAAADEAAGIVEETGVDPEHFKNPLHDLFENWAQQINGRRSAFHPLLEMMASSVRERLEAMSAPYQAIDA